MKILKICFLLPILLAGIILSPACKKKDVEKPLELPLETSPLDISKINIPTNKGDIGLVVDVRPIIKKGYFVSKVAVNIEGSLASFSKTIEVDQFTNIGMLKIKREDLSAAQIDQFVKGVKTNLIAYDLNDNEIAETNESSVLYNDTGEPFAIDTDLPSIVPPLKIIPGRAYHIVEVPKNNNDTIARLMTVLPRSGGGFVYVSDFIGNSQKRLQTFYFEPVSSGSPYFYIKSGYNNMYVDYYYGRNRLETYTDKPPNLPDNYKFQLIQDAQGAVSIKPIHTNILRKNNYGDIDRSVNPVIKGSLLSAVQVFPNAVKFNLVLADIDWEVRDLGVVYNDPIFPPVKLEFAFHNLLNNCSSATLNETIGVVDTRTTTYTVGSEESFQLTTAQESSLGITSGVTANASFSGVGVEASVEVSSNYTFSRSLSKTNTRTFSNSTQKEVQVSRIRSLTIKPYTAVQVYDAVETYRNVRIPFIQKLRVNGSANGDKLSGEEIVSQMYANQFGGVITDIGTDHVIISVRGTALIDNLMKASTSSKDAPGGCPER